jgi:Threonine dehydratase
MAGNGTIGLEILEDLPDPDAVVIPYGGGGLTTGIASAVKALRPGTRIVTAEPDTAAALVAAFAAGHPADVDYRPSFVDGSGSRRVLDSMWPLVSPLVDDAVAVPVAEVGRRCGRSPSGSGSSPRARARSPRRRAERPGRHREDRLRGLGRQHQPGQARRDPRRGRRVTPGG